MNKKKWIWLMVAILGILFLLIGIWRGEELIVFIKGSNICLECIGIG